jgi:DNA-directed RNA polymerase subunit beta
LAKNEPTVVNFASVRKFDYPDFLDIQVQSFKDFFQIETNPDNRLDEGLFKVFK